MLLADAIETAIEANKAYIVMRRIALTTTGIAFILALILLERCIYG